MSNDKPRPALITILGAIQAIIGLIYLVMGIISIVSGYVPAVGDLMNDITAAADLSMILTPFGIVNVIIGIIYLIVAKGFLSGWSIMWYVGVLVNILALIGGIFIFMAGGFIMVVISLIILLYLFKKNVKEFFLG